MKSYVLVVVTTMFLFSCENNKSDDSGSVNDVQRIRQAFYDYEGDEDDWKSEFTYEGENLTLVIEFSRDEQGAWEEAYKAEITYSGMYATAIWYRYLAGNWEPIDKNVYTIENGQITEELNYNIRESQWIEDWKWTYQYSGSNLIAWQSYEEKNNGSLIQDGKGEYIYNNNLLTEHKAFEKNESGEWVQYDRETFSYSGSDLTGWVDFDLDDSQTWIESYKCDYSYAGDNISTAMYYDWDNEINNWETESFSEFYSYDNAGYLTGRNDDDGDKIIITYEEGKGNASLFWYFPEDLTYGKPTFKTTNARNRFVPYNQRMNHWIKYVR